MSEQQTDNTSNNAENPVIPLTATSEYVDEPANDTPQTEPEANKTNQIEKEPVQVNVNIPKQDSGSANTIAIIGLVVNAIMLFVTYLLFREANTATNLSNDALKTTQESVAESKRANDIAQSNLELAKKQAASNDTISNYNLELSKQSLGAQIGSIKESQKQFYASHQPYIQIEITYLDELNIGMPMNMEGTFANVTQTPAKMISQRNCTYYSELPYPIDENLKYTNDAFGNMYAIYGLPSTIHYNLEDKVTERTKTFLEGNAYIILHSEIIYQNLVTGDYRMYKVVAKIKKIYGKNYPNDIFIEFVTNENYNIDKPYKRQ